MQIFFVATRCESNVGSVMAKPPMLFSFSCVQLGVQLVTFLAVGTLLQSHKAEMLILSIAKCGRAYDCVRYGGGEGVGQADHPRGTARGAGVFGGDFCAAGAWAPRAQASMIRCVKRSGNYGFPGLL